jgi:hypothetical protein
LNATAWAESIFMAAALSATNLEEDAIESSRRHLMATRFASIPSILAVNAAMVVDIDSATSLVLSIKVSANSINLASLLNKCQVASVFGISNGINEHCRILVVRCRHRRSVREEGWRILLFKRLGKIVALLINM